MHLNKAPTIRQVIPVAELSLILAALAHHMEALHGQPRQIGRIARRLAGSKSSPGVA
jgi:hypothetical protein